jgi:hypothetical protein
MPALLINHTRPLFPLVEFGVRKTVLFERPDEIRFTERPNLLPQYEAVTRYALMNNHHDIGFVTNGDDWEYPFWRLFQHAGIEPLRIEHLHFDPSLGQLAYPLGVFKPSMIVSRRRGARPCWSSMGANGHEKWHFQI